MMNFSTFLEEFKQQLSRELQDNELEFIKWMYENYKEEQSTYNHC
ncbi:hypothetical protein [Radiobacillus deserti]|nr:hypothetical protein [Radiobacillus deserti]